MNALAQAAVIGGLSLAAAGGTYLVKGSPDRSTPPVVCNPAALAPGELCLDQVIERGAASFVWIDARPRSDWKATGYPGSVLWNLEPNEDVNAFAAEAAAHLFEGSPVIVYCGDESCGISRQVAEQIRQLGMGNEVFTLFGGWQALRSAGLVAAPSAP